MKATLDADQTASGVEAAVVIRAKGAAKKSLKKDQKRLKGLKKQQQLQEQQQQANGQEQKEGWTSQDRIVVPIAAVEEVEAGRLQPAQAILISGMASPSPDGDLV